MTPLTIDEIKYLTEITPGWASYAKALDGSLLIRGPYSVFNFPFRWGEEEKKWSAESLPLLLSQACDELKICIDYDNGNGWYYVFNDKPTVCTFYETANEARIEAIRHIRREG